jgi:uncharacterized protein
MKKIISALPFILFCLTGIAAAAQSRDTAFVERPIRCATDKGEIAGTLTLSDRGPKGPVALIISGSGPTDRNGNSIFTKNNSLQMLARELANMGIASVRYDKRGVVESAKLVKSETDLRFEDYINDAVAWIQLLKKDERFSTIIIIGHSEGSLIGMVAAARAGADKFVSLAGTGRPIDQILKEQLKTASAELYNLAVPVIDSLKQGLLVKVIDKKLLAIFRPSVQPYMISWFKYDPQVEIKKLKIPVLILQGSNDIQVPVDDANKLAAALPAAQLLVIEHMNHILKKIEGDRDANAATYIEPMRPLAPGLVEAVTKFVQKN